MRLIDETNLPKIARKLAQKDEHLAIVLDRYGVPPLWSRKPGFATLLQIILEQQVSLASAKACFDKLTKRVGTVTPENLLASTDEPYWYASQLTSLPSPYRILQSPELKTAAPDGYPVHGWLVAPAGEGPHPVLLLVHGGPHAAYTPALFDEAQVYAGAGYAVVMGNPRGSASYGQQHGRATAHRRR